MISIGDTLRRERLKRNLDVGSVSGALKISPKFIEAIEAEHFDKLPGGVFTRSFVRQYASYLGLDSDEMVTEVRRLVEPEPAVPEVLERERLDIPVVQVEYVDGWRSVINRRHSLPSWVAAGALLIAFMLISSGLYWWWDRAHHDNVVGVAAATRAYAAPPPASTPAPAPPASVTATEPPPLDASPSTAAPAASAAPANSAATTKPAASPTPSPAATQPPSTTPSVTSAGATSPTAQPVANPAAKPADASTIPVPTPNPNASVHVGITAAEPVWIRAEVNGKTLFAGTLMANETRNIDADGEVKLRVGNAGGVNLTLNGKAIGPIGPKGQIRNVQFTSGGFQIVSAPNSFDPLDRF